MNEENTKLLDEVIEKRLNQALNSSINDEGVNVAFKQAMDAIDRRLELYKIDAANEQALKKQELAEQEVDNKQDLAERELENKQELLEQERRKQDLAEEELLKKQERAEREAKINSMIRVAELVVITLAVPVIQHRCNMRYAKVLCNFEKDYTFTTTAGRSLSRLFRFSK